MFNTTLTTSEFIEAVISSAAPPVFFPPQTWGGSTWADGGVVCNLPIYKAV